MNEFDVVVIGGGPAGETVAQYAIKDSSRTAAIVEDGLLGGECSYYACMPSKALLRPLDVAASAKQLSGIATPGVDVAGLLARRDHWVHHYDDAEQRGWADSTGITVLDGRGSLAGDRQISIDDRAGRSSTVRAREAVVLATGSVPVVPPLFDDILPWSSRDATALQEVPDSIGIVGGGAVACEAATWLAALGSAVTMVVRGDRLLARLEPAAGRLVQQGLEKLGVQVLLDTQARSVERDSARQVDLGRVHGGEVRLTLSDGSTVSVSELLLATGRRPALDGLGLDTVGLKAGSVPEESMLPSWLYLVGDVSGDAPLTHWGKYRARVLGERIATRSEGREEAVSPSIVPVPQVVFTDPQVATVGLTVDQADEQGKPVRALSAPYSSAAGAALLRDEVSGEAILVIDPDTETLLGATFVGPEVAELVHAATVAIVGQVPIDVLRHAVPSYPTASEIWLRLLES